MTDEKKLNGVIYHRKGIRILRVWGTPEDMGYAHGYLLAQEIMDGVSELIGVGGLQYQNVLRACQRRLIAPAWAKAEAVGLLKGLQDALPPAKRKIAALGREIGLLDLWAVNTYSEWTGLGCSSVSAWGSITRDGHTLLARNLDYMPFDTCTRNHVVIARKPKDGTAWVSFCWPGALGCYTGFSANGVAAMVHDAWACKQKRNRQYVSRQVAFQALLQDVDNGPRFTANAADALRRYPTIRGSSLHVAGRTGACVLEYDDDRTHDDGVTRRLPNVGETWLACTNSFQARVDQGACGRLSHLSATMRELASYMTQMTDNDRLDLYDMWEIVGTVGNAITLQTVVVDTTTLDVLVGLAAADCPAHEKKPVKLAWEEFWTASDDGTRPAKPKAKVGSWLQRVLGGGQDAHKDFLKGATPDAAALAKLLDGE